MPFGSELFFPLATTAPTDRTVATYRHAFQNVEQQLRTLTQPVATDTKRVQLNALQTTPDRYRFKRSQQPFDPNQLPTRSLQPAPDNRPKLTPAEFTQAGLHNTPLIQLAALGDFTFDQLPDASNPAYLAETDEIVLTQAIRDQAAELHYDPVQIHQWGRNTVEWLPTWGGIQNADLTLSTQRGNSMDIASLNVGKIVITHTDAVSIPGGWSGAGYIILDPETNVGAWKIGGGLNGGYYTLLGEAGGAIFVLADFINILNKARFLGLGSFVTAAVSPYILLALALVIALAGILAVINGPDFSAFSNERNLIEFFTTVSMVGVLLTIGFGPLAGFLALSMMAHVLAVELYLLFI